MNKKIRKSLQLDRSTIRALTRNVLGTVAGGLNYGPKSKNNIDGGDCGSGQTVGTVRLLGCNSSEVEANGCEGGGTGQIGSALC